MCTAVNFCVKSWSRTEVSTATSVSWNSPPRHSHFTSCTIHILHHTSLSSHIFQVLHHRSLTSRLTSHVMHIRHYSHNAPPTSCRTFHITCRVTGHSTFHILRGAVFGDVESALFFLGGGAKHLLELWLHPLHVLHVATAQSTNTTFANWTLVSTNLCAPLWAATRMPHRTTLFTSGTHACWSAPNKLASNYGPGDAGNNIGNWQPTGSVQNVGMTL